MVAEVWAEVGDLDRAESLTQTITEASQQAQALAVLAKAAAGNGDLDRAESLAQMITEAPEQAQALAALAKEAIGTGNLDRAQRLAAQAEALTPATVAPQWAQALADLGEVAARAGDPNRAQALANRAEAAAHATPDRSQQAQALAALVEAAVDSGGPGRAEALARQITDPEQRVRVIAALAKAAADNGDAGRALALAEWAEEAARTITNSDHRNQMLATLAKATSDAGHAVQAEAAAQAITDLDLRARVLAALSEAAREGDLGRYEDLAEQAEAAAQAIPSVSQRVVTLAALTKAAARAGDLDRAKAIIERPAGLASLLFGLSYREPLQSIDIPRRFSLPTARESLLLVVAGLTWMTYTSGFSGFVSYLPTALTLRGFGMAFVGLVVAIAMWGNAVGTLGGGGLATRVGPFNLFLFGTASLVAGMVGLTTTTWLITSAFVMGVLGSLQPGVVMAAATLSARPENRAVGMGIFYTIYYAGGALVPTLCGMAADYAGAPAGGLWAGAGLSLAAIPTFLIHRLLSARQTELVEA